MSNYPKDYVHMKFEFILSAAEIARFHSKYKKGKKDECWNWSNRQCKFSLRGKRVIASRVAYQLANGKSAKNLVCHTCDNGACVNPDHLFDGTYSANTRDALNKGRFYQFFKDGVKHTRAAFKSMVTIRLIRQLYAEGWSQSKLGRRFGVAQSCICKIVNRFSYAQD